MRPRRPHRTAWPAAGPLAAALLLALLAGRTRGAPADDDHKLNSIGGRPAEAPSALLSPSSANQVLADAQDQTSGQSNNNNNNNVIIIKYANLTAAGQSQAGAAQQEPELTNYHNYQQQYHNMQLHTFKLAEPLTVQVIETKFAHAIQLFDVSSNQLASLAKDLFCPLSNEVRLLNISHNLLVDFDSLGLISQAGQLCLSELKHLDMSFNLIKHLPATGVATLHNLEILNLSNNLLESLDELSLSSLFKLAQLNLSHNRLKLLPVRLFQKSHSMRQLYMQFNSIQQPISQLFLSGLIALEELNLAHNNVTHLAEHAFADKLNLSRVDLSHNQLTGLHQDALRVSGPQQAAPAAQQPAWRHQSGNYIRQRLHHNGQFAAAAPQGAPAPQQLQQLPAAPAEQQQQQRALFYLAANPFVCDCQLEWLRRWAAAGARQRPGQQSWAAAEEQSEQLQNDEPSANSPVISAPATSGVAQANNNISEINSINLSEPQQHRHHSSAAAATNNNNNNIHHNHRAGATLLTNSPVNQQPQQQPAPLHQFGRIGDLDLVKCSPLFRRNSHQQQRHIPAAPHHVGHGHHVGGLRAAAGRPAPAAPPEGAAANQQVELASAEPSNFLCRYKSHCFALCHCCEFDACDCEMICPAGCNCYYDSTWQTNIIDCSSANHTTVPDRIPMDVSGLYLDGNQIESLKPSNLIARKSLRVLYLNSTQLKLIANRTFNGLIELQSLYLNDNQLVSLYGYEFEPLQQLRALHLQSNKLEFINNQTFSYLRALETLDLSGNRLRSAAHFDLFWSIGHQNIRLRQLSLAHNWWSCNCHQVQRLRQLLKQKFLLAAPGLSSGQVHIVDRHQLRCYHNATHVGPLILGGGSSPAELQVSGGRQALAELNACSSLAGGGSGGGDEDELLLQHQAGAPATAPTGDQFEAALMAAANQQATPPAPLSEWPQNDVAGLGQTGSPSDSFEASLQARNKQQQQQQQQQQQLLQPQQTAGNAPGANNNNMMQDNYFGQPAWPPAPAAGPRFDTAPGRAAAAPLPVSSFALLALLSAGLVVLALSVLALVRRQQRQHLQHRHAHHLAANHHHLSGPGSAAGQHLRGHHHHHHQRHPSSGSSSRSSGSSSADSSASGAKRAAALAAACQQPLMSATLPAQPMGPAQVSAAAVAAGLQLQQRQQQQHSTSASTTSSSNIYASLVAPPGAPAGSAPANQLIYSNAAAAVAAAGKQAGRPLYAAGVYALDDAASSQYGLGAPSSYYAKTLGGALQGARGQPAASRKLRRLAAGLVDRCRRAWQAGGQLAAAVERAGAFSGPAADQLASSDKIYDAFLSYDKRDEPFVMQHLSAELEYGQPQYRIADRYRDLPLASAGYLAEAIASMVGSSHRTLVVLSRNYLANEWCRYELQAALRESQLDRSHRLLVVVLEAECVQQLDAEARALLGPHLQQPHQLVATLAGTRSQPALDGGPQPGSGPLAYLSYEERKFWPRLKRAMPAARAAAAAPAGQANLSSLVGGQLPAAKA